MVSRLGEEQDEGEGGCVVEKIEGVVVPGLDLDQLLGGGLELQQECRQEIPSKALECLQYQVLSIYNQSFYRDKNSVRMFYAVEFPGEQWAGSRGRELRPHLG